MQRFEQPAHRPVPKRLVEAHPGYVPRIYTHPDTLLVAFAFDCNLACTFCMVEDALGRYPGTPLEVMEDFVGDSEAMRGITRVILSGGEVTLDEHLLAYVAAARRAPSVQSIRLQTNATRLHDRGFTRSLIDAGVTEFFVSLHGADAQTCDAITQRPGSLKAILRGVDTIRASGAQWLSNTCIVQRNVEHLAAIAQLAVERGASGCEFWNVWPRVDQPSLRRDIAPVSRIAPHLLDALQVCQRAGVSPVVKWFPRCLLGEAGAACDDSQPTALIDAAYWQQLPGYACLFGGVCAHGQRCAGLSTPYVETHGWEVDLLRPQRAVEQQPAPQRSGAMATQRAADPVARAGDESKAGALALRLGLRVGTTVDGWRLTAMQPAGAAERACFERPGAQPQWLRFAHDKADAQALARAADVAISYEQRPGAASHGPALVKAIVARAAARQTP